MTDEPPAPPVEPQPAPQPDPVPEREARIAELEDKVQRFKETLARVQADYENYRKRVAREKDETAVDARLPLVRALVEVLDDVERASLAAKATPAVAEGLVLTGTRIASELARLGVVKIAPGPGDAFEPEVHEAVMTVPTDEHPAGTVATLLAPGYSLGGRLVRPAMVQVAQAPAT